MGKNKNKKKRASRQPTVRTNNPSESSSAEPSRRTNVLRSARHLAQLPLPYPHSSDLKIPDGEFLRNEDPYKKSFDVALNTSYEGFAVDLCNDTKREGNSKENVKQMATSDPSIFPHESIRSALRVMEDAGYFRTDVTQPFGLGTKCAKTYVTRCLLGERGTTYKYLGLRMFAHPWDDTERKENKLKGTTMSLREAIRTIRELNDTLTTRTAFHLSELDKKREKRGADPTRGRAKFDITLINRMENTQELKKEPSMGEGRCSVSWHADSSLEQYSSIGVYHTIFPSPPKDTTVSPCKESARWSVALRVAHNSEGPQASRRGTDIDSSIVKETPPIAVSLPSGSAYYLLDDFNHHHQHAVIASGTEKSTEDAGVRFSSTHRLLRESHNVDFIIERCRVVCSNFHKKGPKIWRSEQLLLTEVESEWLRQYYIQGNGHNLLLWKSWGDPIRSLLRYWSQLESRTKQVLDLLRAGAEGRCGRVEATTNIPSRAERKMREKRKKASATLEDLLSRSGEQNSSYSTTDRVALDVIYEPFAVMLEERATMRELWTKRASDHVFREMGRDCLPIPLPVDFGVSAQQSKSSERGSSPLPGTAEDLRFLANCLRAQGKSFVTQDPTHLPDLSFQEVSISGDASPEGTVPSQGIGKDTPMDHKMTSESEHSKSLAWEGWKREKFGLEMQSPWAELLLEGRKTIETRTYDLPSALLGKRIEIVKSRNGIAGVSSLANMLTLGENHTESLIEVIGWCTFSRVIKYANRDIFEADENHHLVTKDSGYGWKEGKTKVVFGWVVGESGRYNQGSQSSVPHLIVRRMRSLFEFQAAPTHNSSPACKVEDVSATKNAGGKKRKRSFRSMKKKWKKRK